MIQTFLTGPVESLHKTELKIIDLHPKLSRIQTVLISDNTHLPHYTAWVATLRLGNGVAFSGSQSKGKHNIHVCHLHMKLNVRSTIRLSIESILITDLS